MIEGGAGAGPGAGDTVAGGWWTRTVVVYHVRNNSCAYRSTFDARKKRVDVFRCCFHW